MCTSFSISPSIRRETGTPVHLETISATSSASTSSFRNRGAAVGDVVLGRLGRLERLLELGDRPVLQLGGAAQIGLALGALELDPRLLELLLDLGDGAERSPSRAATRRASRPSARAPRPAPARAARGARPCRGRRRRQPSDCSSISSCMMCRSTSSISVGLESISIRIRDAASSTRSIALSGRKRSAM